MECITEVRSHIRWMIRRDMPEVLQIEESEQWSLSEADILQILRQRNCIGMIIEDEDPKSPTCGKIMGYMIYELHKHHLELLKLVVDPQFRHRGLGSTMIRKLQYKLNSHKRTALVVNVRETNLQGQIFLKELGFIATNVLREHFCDSNEDAYEMRYCLKEF